LESYTQEFISESELYGKMRQNNKPALLVYFIPASPLWIKFRRDFQLVAKDFHE